MSNSIWYYTFICGSLPCNEIAISDKSIGWFLHKVVVATLFVGEWSKVLKIINEQALNNESVLAVVKQAAAPLGTQSFFERIRL